MRSTSDVDTGIYTDSDSADGRIDQTLWLASGRVMYSS